MEKDLFHYFYVRMLKSFLAKRVPSGKSLTSFQVDDLMDYYHVFIKLDKAYISLTHTDNEYVYGYSLFNDSPAYEEDSNRKVHVAIKLSEINWSYLSCNHYYKIGRRIQHSFKIHVLRALSKKHWFEWKKIKRFDDSIASVSDRYEVLAFINEKSSLGETASSHELMEYFYGKQVHKSTKQSSIRHRIKLLAQSLDDDGLIKFQFNYITYDIVILPKGISELARYKEENRRHLDSIRSAKKMEAATWAMFMAVCVQAAAAVLTYIHNFS